MTEFCYTIKDELGIHARPAGMLVKEADKFKSEIIIHLNDNQADAKRIFSIMALGVKCGDKLRITASGEDEEKAKEIMENFFKANL